MRTLPVPVELDIMIDHGAQKPKPQNGAQNQPADGPSRPPPIPSFTLIRRHTRKADPPLLNRTPPAFARVSFAFHACRSPPRFYDYILRLIPSRRLVGAAPTTFRPRRWPACSQGRDFRFFDDGRLPRKKEQGKGKIAHPRAAPPRVANNLSSNLSATFAQGKQENAAE